MTMGKYLEGKECRDCPIGSYCSGDGLKVDCGIGFTTSVTKSIKKDECYATCLIQGKYLDGKECKDCPIGSYCTGLGTKISCPLGHTTLNVKSVDKADCVSTCREKGRYLDGAECKDCRKGHYCPGDGTDQTCAPGYTTSRTKCGEPSDCIPASPTPSGGVTSRRRAQTCNQGWSMCKLKTGRGEMQCVDTSNSLDMCGNCDNDCSTIPGARAVRCSVGLCVISECDPGLKPSGSHCVPKR
ncbi:hypothetical protein DL96DRAFT_1027043 [Flagelloscypha sp. PMI_526]|nr:hypothetical protein DL96DRAFT_1027043 [Flagelloscypha sp. PMI_526]